METCTYPLTGRRCVSRIYTDLAVLDVTPTGLTVRETGGRPVARASSNVAPLWRLSHEQIALDVLSCSSPPRPSCRRRRRSKKARTAHHQGTRAASSSAARTSRSRSQASARMPRPITGDITVNQMYVQYQIPMKGDQHVPVVMVHGCCLSSKTWETTPDGRMGWSEYFVRKDRSVYLADQVSRARSGFDPTAFADVAAGQDAAGADAEHPRRDASGRVDRVPLRPEVRRSVPRRAVSRSRRSTSSTSR